MNAPHRRAIAAAALLSSDRDGEVIAAARGLNRLLRGEGLDPASVIAAGLAAANTRPAPTSPPPFAAEPLWKRRARMAQACPYLTDWESNFLTGVVGQRGLSEKQEERLRAILAKAEGRR